jgi:hypothetical protein
MIHKLLFSALLTAALSGSLTAANQTGMDIQVSGSDRVTLEVGWADEDVAGLELLEWTKDLGAQMVIRGPRGARSCSLEIIDGKLVLVVGAVGEEIPEDPDDPDIDPNGQVPEGHLGLTKQTYGWVTDLVDLSKDPDRRKHAQAQAENYATVAAGFLSVPPKWDSIDLAFEALRAANRDILPQGPIRDAWGAFSLRMSERIEALWPFDESEAAKILSAIAKGLQLVE